jgi:sugar phosphate isomerase/epimerase
VPAAVECLANRIVHAYARDAKAHAGESPVGSGDVPWPEYLAALSGMDYTGPIVIAPLSGPGARESAARAAEFLRRF